MQNRFKQTRCAFLLLLLVTLLVSARSVAQSGPVTGSVTDTLGQPLPGASVTINGSSRGALTDEKGAYKVEVSTGESLRYSFAGMEDQVVSVRGQRMINVVLMPKKDALSEVTVVAFGSQKKESVVGAITTVKPAELKTPSSNLTTALAGRVAGMIAFQQSGEPGLDNANFFIRGVTSFGNQNRPLILVDGIEMSATELARLQVDDIASFSVMKDATATSLYGARGANGVILITTKEGKESRAIVAARYERSISSPTRKIEIADPVTYMELANEAVMTRDRLGLVPYSQEKIENTMAGKFPLLYPTTDWYSMLLKNNTQNQRLNLNVSGGGKVARYYVAATYNQDNGLLKVDKRNNFNNNIDLKTFGLRANVNMDLTRTTEALVRLNSTWTDYTGPIYTGSDIYSRIMKTNPVLYPAYYPPDAANELTEHILFGNSGSGNYSNPYADLVKGYRNYTNAMVLAQFELKQDLNFITPGLKLSAMYNTTRYNYYSVQRAYNPYYYALADYDKTTGVYLLQELNPTTGREYLDYAETGKDVSSENYFQGILNYSPTLKGDHTFSSTLVYTMLNKLAANAGSLQNSLPHRNMGLAGRFTYGLMQRYFLEANFGYNGSERFSQSHRFGFFPSIGGAWYVSKEKFWSDGLRKIINNLKIRASYGLVGNDAIGTDEERFFFLSEVDMNASSRSYMFGSEFSNTIVGVLEKRYANPNITWETSRKSNLSFEVGLLNAANLTIDLYREYRYNILLQRSFIPYTMGLAYYPKANLGEASSKGIDVALEVSRSLSNNWFISGRGNFTYATNKIRVYDEPDYSATPWKSRIGYPINQTWGYVAERLFVDDAEVENSPAQGADAMGGDIKFRDINNDGVIDQLDQVPIGYPTVPEIIYGFGISTTYKNVDFSVFLQGLGRRSFWINAAETTPFVGGTGYSNQLLKAYADDHWSEDNRNIYALWPRLAPAVNNNNVSTSTWFMQNGSFLRVKQVELGYTMPERLIHRLKLTKLRIYTNGTNLFNFSRFKLWDPEMGGNGLGYPLQRVVNFGIQCTL
ncbi:SusC/RagA family TonB-linked outer membrane protein [Niabella drilacis]|uniref:TonB-linked outer membrane protein, SusC/RagA family n=1 Tax=Niabella drilacis (strain DSM 25811 / CCM 8410 / CCUG 62505 / LMG 26954 / E90) TaxID=1285928 RepID=A0A1G6Y0Z2_NIADE|nr:TonB-dependent receptor [Niabella drilacis]SDD83941.1 TonB-linked outer membrane protein, SusC/RagA family [Niabella drilacis]